MSEEKDPKLDALTKVAEASGEHEQAQDDERAARRAHHAAIVAALRAGNGPSAIERVSHYDRQHIDRIRRDAGIAPTRKPTVQRIPKEE